MGISVFPSHNGSPHFRYVLFGVTSVYSNSINHEEDKIRHFR